MDEPAFAVWVGSPAICLTPASFPSRRAQPEGTRYEGCAEVPAAVSMLRRGEDLSLVIDTGRPLRIDRVQFPRVSVPDVHTYDELLMPGGFGDAIADPVKAIQLYGRRQRRQPPRGLTFVDNTGDEIIYYCPAFAGMQYMVLHNPGRSVSVACYATGPDGIAFRARAADDRQLVLSVEHYPGAVAGRWESPACGVREFSGGWHAAADHYRERMAPHRAAPRWPDWIAEGGFHGKVGIRMHTAGQPPACRFGDLPDLMRRVLDHGHDVMALYGWAGVGHDTLYPDYEPDPALGTAAELRRALDQVRAMGGRGVLYTNGKLISTRSRFFLVHGPAASVCDADGEPWREQYGTEDVFHVACPGSRLWREHFVGVVRRLVGEYGASGVTLDQIASTWHQPCWRRDHEHGRSHDNVLPGMEAMLAEVRDAGRALDPDFFTWPEGCQDRLGQFFDVHWGGYSEYPHTALSVTVGRKFPEQFRFTWPRALVMGSARDIPSLCHVFCQGKSFDIPEGLDGFRDPAFAALHARLLRLRRELPEFFARGTFRADEGVAAAPPARAFVIRGEGRFLLSLWVPGSGPSQAWRVPVRLAERAEVGRRFFPDDLAATPQEIAFRGPLAVLEFTGDR